jgi:serine/threonine-protein kinase
LESRYRIERELGGGGMSRVFLARETQLNREVVIKVLSADVAAGVSLERFAREIQLAASLQQANIVPLLSAGDADGVPYFTMPYVHGESLRRRLAEGPRLTIAECTGILRDVARALSYAHGRGVVHRDIKPDNVLLSHGAAVVTDFGIAKALTASRGQRPEHGECAGAPHVDTLTQLGTSLGTPAYMSPEQVAGDPNIDHRADLYAWACLAYEVLTGAPPFVKDSPQRTLAAHLSEAPAPVSSRRPDVPQGLERLVMRCLAKEPGDRPASADEVLHDLESVMTPIDSSAGHPPRSTGPGFAGATPRRAGARSVAVGIAILAIATVTWFATRGGSADSAGPSGAADRSIAVLPLANLSGDKADDYFGIGLAEEMTRALAKTGVRVIGRISAGALLARGLDERAIARELGVGSLLTGSVQRAAEQVRINVSLLSAKDGSVRWTEKYDRPLTNVFAVQDEIARAVAERLLGSLGAAPAAAARIETADANAYALYLQGMVLFGRRTAQTLQQAISLFEQAVARDPKFARAQASLAMAIAALPFYTQGDDGAAFARARGAAERAIAIDSMIAESYTALGFANYAIGNNRDADRYFRTALSRDSTVMSTWGWYGLLANNIGDHETAHRRIARARELEPASSIARTWVAQTLLVERRYHEADSVSAETIALDSTFALIRTVRAEALLFLGRTEEAISILERQVADLPPNPSPTHGILTYAYARAGQTEKARALLETQRVAARGRIPATGSLAAALDLLGDHEAAIALLRDAVAEHNAWLSVYVRGERYDKLRRDPRAVAVLAKLTSW